MRRFATVGLALGLWAGPTAAQELRLDPPALSANAARCTAQQRATCEGIGQRALDMDLSCDDCAPLPMPADLIAPKGPAAPSRPAASPDCLPRASGPLPPSCVPIPRLDQLPRP